MANYIKPPLLDKTGKEIVAALTGEAAQPSASKINSPISDETGKAILNAIQQGGCGGGANVLTLYIGTKDKYTWAYKNQERNVEYESYDEARTAIVNASSIKLFADDNTIVFPMFANARDTAELKAVTVTALSDGEPMPITLYSHTNPK